MRSRGIRAIAALAGAALVASACGSAQPPDVPDRHELETNPTGHRAGSIIGGDGGLDLFGAFRGDARDGAPGVGIGVNSFLWRASLDTLSFMPLTSADPFGGVIITDWYAPPETPDERFKMNVYILARDLRADGLKVAVFRQHRDGTNGWSDAEVTSETAANLENQILTRARQLRLSASAR